MKFSFISKNKQESGQSRNTFLEQYKKELDKPKNDFKIAETPDPKSITTNTENPAPTQPAISTNEPKVKKANLLNESWKKVKEFFSYAKKIIKPIVSKILAPLKLTRPFKLLDKILLGIFMSGLLISGIIIIGSYLLPKKFERVPIEGGTINEVMIGQPNKINPLFVNPIIDKTLEENIQVDDDICSLVFSSLFKTNKKGELVNDLVDSYTNTPDHKTYTIKIKQNIRFKDQNRTRLTVDDIIFTINLIKDSKYNTKGSTSLTFWQDVTIEKIDDYSLKITQKEARESIKKKMTFGILSKQNLEGIEPQKMNQSITSLIGTPFFPVGSGPFYIKNINFNKTTGNVAYIELKKNDGYYGEKISIDTLKLSFYNNLEDVLNKDKNKLGRYNFAYFPQNYDEKKYEAIDGKVLEFPTSMYYSLFINLNGKSVFAKDATLRKALINSTDKEAIIKEVYNNHGVKSSSVIPTQSDFFNQKLKYPEYSLKEAEEIFNKAGWKDKDSNGYRKKGNEILSLEIILEDKTIPKKITEQLIKQYKEIGVKVTMKTDTRSNILENHEYDSVLYGIALDETFDILYYFWHSEQAGDGGYNFARLRDSELDKAIETSRASPNLAAKQTALYKIQEIINQKNAFIPIASANYVYVIDEKIKHAPNTNDYLLIDPKNRFNILPDLRLKEKIIIN